MTVPHFFLLLSAILVGAKVLGELAEALGQPAILGEIVAGVLLGGSVLKIVQPDQELVHMLAELGVVILLFQIGLETNLRALLEVGGAAGTVAVAGVVTPMALGVVATRALGLDLLPALVASAALTATSVGITARVLSDLGFLNQPEGRVVLGAAVFDDVLGLIILAVISGLVAGESVQIGGIAKTVGIAFGFLMLAVVLGRLVMPRLFGLLNRIGKEPTLASMGFVVALVLAVLAQSAGLAPIIGAFAAGLVVGETEQAPQVRSGVLRLGYFFVPVFFVVVGAAVDVHEFLDGRVLGLGLALIAVGVAGKVVAGYAPWWFEGRKLLVGVAMIPRGEVGLIFARMGLASGVLDSGMYAAIMMMVAATTLAVPPLLYGLIGRAAGPREEAGGVAELAAEA